MCFGENLLMVKPSVFICPKIALVCLFFFFFLFLSFLKHNFSGVYAGGQVFLGSPEILRRYILASIVEKIAVSLITHL